MWFLALIFVIPCVFVWIAFQLVLFLVWMILEGVLLAIDWIRDAAAAP